MRLCKVHNEQIARAVVEMAVTVADLLQLAFPDGTQVVAGRAGLGREVVWARTLRPRPPAFESIDGGELALLSSNQLSMLESVTLGYVIKRLAEVGVAAVAVLGEVDSAACEAADGVEMPLIRLPGGVSLTEIERAAIATIVDRQAELQRKASEIHRQLAQLVFEERGLQAVAERLADVSGKAVSIEDDLFRLRFAASSPSVPNPEELDLRVWHGAIEEWVRTVTLSSAQPPVGRFPIKDSDLARFVAPVPSREGVAGYLSVIGPAVELTELDRLAAGRGAAVCAMEVSKAAAVEEAESRVRGDLLDQLLSTGLEDDQIALGKARRLGYDPTLPSVVMAFRVTSQERQWVSSPLRSPERTRVQLESLVRVEMSRRESKCLVATRGASVLAVFPLSAGSSDRIVKAAAEDVRRAAESAFSGSLIAVGIGRPTSAGASLAAAHREAEEALGIGIKIHGPSSTTFFGDLGIVRLLAQVERLSELESFHEELLGKLETHDHKTGSELLKTLEVLFRCHGNLTRAAEQLSLHRNSLLYRMERVQEISGLNLEDPEIRLSLQVALRIRQLLEAQRSRRGQVG
jgi:PucR family transcriptional regulator, purine catabolism regulatory protein